MARPVSVPSALGRFERQGTPPPPGRVLMWRLPAESRVLAPDHGCRELITPPAARRAALPVTAADKILDRHTPYVVP
jgi:hypothetical protein